MESTAATRVSRFAAFFKNYMSVSAVVTAALPIPVTALGAIPAFADQKAFLSVYTSLFCFLALGFLFYSRHQLARLMFPEFFQRMARASPRGRGRLSPWPFLVAWLPALLILASLCCVLGYHAALDASVAELRRGPDVPNEARMDEILQHEASDSLERSVTLPLWYLGIFVSAEAAFILMALREYLQDLVGLSEQDLIYGPLPAAVAAGEGAIQSEGADGP